MTPHPLGHALGQVIDVLDRLAKVHVQANAVWTYHNMARIHHTIGLLHSTGSAHEKMAYESAKRELADVLQVLEPAMATVPSVAYGAFQWSLSSEKTGQSLKPSMALNGVTIAKGSAQTLRKSAADIAAFLAKLPAHNHRTYVVGGTRLMAANPDSALALWAALHQKGKPTAQKTRELLTSPKRPELLQLLDVDSTLLAATASHL